MKNNILTINCIFSFLFFLCFEAHSSDQYLAGDILEAWEGGPAYYAKWINGPSSDSTFFPITVWYQTPGAGYFYKQMGVNFFTYWGSPASTTEADLVKLKQYSMSGITGYTDMYLNSVNNAVVKGWFHPQDEPDNAISGTEDPVPTATIINDYNNIVAKDSTRPVFINLGQGAAIDSWYGRGNRTYHPEDYIEYAKGADVISFDVYPMNQKSWVSGVDASWKYPFMTALSGNIWYVAIGVDNLRKATDYKKPIWAFIECTNYNSSTLCKLTPVETKAEVWMALIHGARGIGYFCHILSPTVVAAGVLNDAAMKAEITSINANIKANAPILNTQTVSNAATVNTGSNKNPVDIMVKRYGGFTYIYAVSMRPGTPTATFTLREFSGVSTIEVVGETRTIPAADGVFQDTFTNWGVHIYKVATQKDINALNTIDDNSVLQIKSSSNTITFSSTERIDEVEIFTVSGQKLYSRHVLDSKFSIQIDKKSVRILIARIRIKDNFYVRKLIVY